MHSEILSKHIELVMTKRGVRLVDEAGGFDSYLLSTPVNEVYATGLLRIKRELLLTLATPDRLPGSLEQKYQSFVVPWEVADWHGLTYEEAKVKQAVIEERARDAASRMPDKLVFRKQLLEELKSGDVLEELVEESTDQPGFFSKIFKK